MLYPLTFQPIFKERVWGGRHLERLYQKALPREVPIGESWEISDRPGDASVIANGPLAGKDLHWLVENQAADLLGSVRPYGGRFPLLIKLLDAREKLSLQVHPPAAKAKELGGEPKTEMWYIADAGPGAELYVGLKRGVTRQGFEQELQKGSVADCFHRVPVKAGDVMFLPSGRVHAIGAGLVIFEIQQNSDTTYRVFDWNRVGLDGKPRALHISESLTSIDFEDFEPGLVSAEFQREGVLKRKMLAKNALFQAELVTSISKSSEDVSLSPGTLRIIAVVSGRVTATGASVSAKSGPGQFCLNPASARTQLSVEPGSAFLLIQPGD